VNDPDPIVTFSIPDGRGHAERSWADDAGTVEPEYLEYPTVDRTAAFASVGFIAAALKRGAWIWCATAVFGLLIGYGLYAKFPPAYQATTSVLLTNNPNLDPSQIQTNASLAQSTAVAGRVVQQLGLQQSVSSFIASYTVTPVGEQVLVITIGAPSSTEAVRRASALVTGFLQFRAQMLTAQQQLESTLLDPQINQAQQQISSINNQISQISAEPTSAGQQATVGKLRAQLSVASNTLVTAQAEASSAQLITSSMVKGSEVINAATLIPHRFRQSRAYYLALALIASLAIGMIIVIIRALVSDRVRTRSDVADVMGAPVRLSVGRMGGRGRLLGLGTRGSAKALDSRRVVTHLSGAVRRNPRGQETLAVVAVGNGEVVARAVVSLAVSYASQAKRVIIADLSSGTYAARLLGVRGPGVRTVNANDEHLVVAVPNSDDAAPIGPLASSTPQAEPDKVSPPLATAFASADLLLTIATLDPASGGDHLATWATDVVVMVTAGRSSMMSIRAVGELIRLAGMRLVSVVLIGADKSDKTIGLGVTQTLDRLVL
jgi:capsular polysaccharide biosynthesis protein